jgi:type IV secretory pathway VirB4 component
MTSIRTRPLHALTTALGTALGLAEPRREPSGVGPEAAEVTAGSIRVGSDHAATLLVTGYPSEVGAGWLEPLLCYPGRLDVAVHVQPVPPEVASARLRKQLARLEASRRHAAERGRLVDFEVEGTAADAYDLAARMARGQTRLFRTSLYLTVHAPGEAELAAEVQQVRSLAASLLVETHPATFRQLQGWCATLPTGVDTLGASRVFDTAALAASFPFTSPDLPTTDGVLYGTNLNSAGLVCWDRWACDNHNSVILARSGAGKSYLGKLEVLRSLYQGVQVAVVDPEDEYARLAAAVGGAHLRLGAAGLRLNPFDLPRGPQLPADTLTRRALFLHTLLAVLIGELTAQERAVADTAILAAYERAGISSDPRTWARPAPLLADLQQTLTEHANPAGAELAARLAPYVTGNWRGLFDEATTHRPEGHLVVFSLRDLPDELRAAGTLLALDSVWRQITQAGPLRRRLVVVDEAWLLMRDPQGAKFLYRLAKSARKYWTGLSVITQDAADLLGSDLGRAVVANSTTQILLRQAPQALDEIAEAFQLSDGEVALLASADRGEGLLAAGAQRVAFRSLASPAEHQLVHTDPTQLADEDEGGWQP